jgi:hypothetical protein
MPENVWRNVLSAKPVRKSNVTLRSYSGHEISVIGEIGVQVVYGNQKAHLPIIVTNNEGLSCVAGTQLVVGVEVELESNKESFSEACQRCGATNHAVCVVVS